MFESLEKDTTVLERKALEKNRLTQKTGASELDRKHERLRGLSGKSGKRDSIRAAISPFQWGEDLLEALHGLASLKYGEIKEKERGQPVPEPVQDAYEEQKNTLELLKTRNASMIWTWLWSAAPWLPVKGGKAAFAKPGAGQEKC